MPAEHFGLLLLAVANRIHPEFAEHERLFLGQVLQAQEVLFEIALIVQVDVEAAEIDVLREEIFRRRITRVGKENVRIRFASDADERFEKLRHAPHAEPAHHRRRDFVADEITKDGRVPRMLGDRGSHRLHDLASSLCPNEKLHMLRPRESDQHAHAGRGATIEKPARRQMINAHDVDPELAHLGEVAARLLLRAKVIAGRIRLERPVGGALDEKFPVALEEELGERTDADRRSLTHEELFLVQRADGRKAFARPLPNEKPSASASCTIRAVASICAGWCAVEMKPVSNCDGAK